MKGKIASILFVGLALLTLSACNSGEKKNVNKKVASSETTKVEKKKKNSSTKQKAKKESASVSSSNSKDVGGNSSTQSDVTTTEESSKAPTESTQESTAVVQNQLSIEGSWTASGKADKVISTWDFNNGELVVNGQFGFTYAVSENLDKNGYTVVTITNSEGESHALLLKQVGEGMEGLTAENQDYQNYLNDETVPVNNQIIEFRKGNIIAESTARGEWANMDEAIDFYEATFKNTENDASKEIVWENYRRDLWSVVKNATGGAQMTLHFANISGAGGSYDQFVKGLENTEITFFGGNASFPDSPTRRYTVRNSDHKIISTEELWNK